MRCALLAVVLAATSARAFAADDVAQESRFISNARQLVFEGKRSGEGYFSRDGKKLIFQSERESDNPFYQQYILDLESGETTRVSPGKGKRRADFSSRGRIECFSLPPTPILTQSRNKKRNWNFARAESSAVTRGITTRTSIFFRRNRMELIPLT